MKKIKQAIAAGVISLAVIFSGGAVLADHGGDKEIAVVNKGDTLYSLAKKHHMSVAQITDLNHLRGTTIYPGQRLILSGKEAGYHKIIAGSFSKKENAEKRAALLKKKEIAAAISTAVIDGKAYYRVQAGAFKDKKNAVKQLEAVKKAGIKDAFILSKEALHIFGLKPGDSYDEIASRMGKPKKTETQLNIKTLYYQGDGAGLRITLNKKDGTIDSLAVYPEYLSPRMFPALPFTRDEVVKIYGDANKTRTVTCYESAKCEELTYQLDHLELKARIDRDQATVQFLELTDLTDR
ncbi:LysM domain-containing protein [Cytobacillus firmus]|uniref:LysM domain-containing protein n=2 Tax=Cytobacillus TaxID=2675230 RepID=A0A366K4H3_CYTFI|nr:MULTISPECIES: LysM peptidoglycan-binding domain-containing protein [Cytobacillus]RBP96635.1 LysM domain-containing protein [Cytobacillus firmus]TDX45638.1 LysM domain-containing protein [Cytobacillus oceanisediminis]